MQSLPFTSDGSFEFRKPTSSTYLVMRVIVYLSPDPTPETNFTEGRADGKFDHGHGECNRQHLCTMYVVRFLEVHWKNGE